MTIEDILILIQSNVGIAIMCFAIAFWVLKLKDKNHELEFKRLLDEKANKEDVHKQDIRLTQLESKSGK